MTDKEHAALQWLDRMGDYAGWVPWTQASTEERKILRAMATAPRVPSPTDHAAIDRVIEFVRDTYKHTLPRGIVGSVFEALHTPSAPKTKTVQVWRVEYSLLTAAGWVACVAQFNGEESAHEFARGQKNLKDRAEIRITGPHSQEVPIELAPAADGCRGRTLAERRA